MSKDSKREPTAKELAQLALTRIGRLSHAAESKYLRTTSSQSNYLASGYSFWASSVPQGVTASTRVGLGLRATRLLLRMKLWDTENSNITFRVLVFRVVGQQGAGLPAVTDLLMSDDTVSPLNPLNVPARYTILADKVYSSNAYFLQQDRVITDEVQIPLNFSVAFGSATGNDFRRNAVGVAITADYASAAGPTIRPLSGEAQSYVDALLRFTDE